MTRRLTATTETGDPVPIEPYHVEHDRSHHDPRDEAWYRAAKAAHCISCDRGRSVLTPAQIERRENSLQRRLNLAADIAALDKRGHKSLYGHSKNPHKQMLGQEREARRSKGSLIEPWSVRQRERQSVINSTHPRDVFAPAPDRMSKTPLRWRP